MPLHWDFQVKKKWTRISEGQWTATKMGTASSTWVALSVKCLDFHLGYDLIVLRWRPASRLLSWVWSFLEMLSPPCPLSSSRVHTHSQERSKKKQGQLLKEGQWVCGWQKEEFQGEPLVWSTLLGQLLFDRRDLGGWVCEVYNTTTTNSNPFLRNF